MALPKYKTSRANTHSRRANWKATAAQTIACPNCGAPALPHMACPSTPIGLPGAAAPTAAACTAQPFAPLTPSDRSRMPIAK